MCARVVLAAEVASVRRDDEVSSPDIINQEPTHVCWDCTGRGNCILLRDDEGVLGNRQVVQQPRGVD